MTTSSEEVRAVRRALDALGGSEAQLGYQLAIGGYHGEAETEAQARLDAMHAAMVDAAQILAGCCVGRHPDHVRGTASAASRP